MRERERERESERGRERERERRGGRERVPFFHSANLAKKFMHYS
jgi:hypothetical protein